MSEPHAIVLDIFSDLTTLDSHTPEGTNMTVTDDPDDMRDNGAKVLGFDELCTCGHVELLHDRDHRMARCQGAEIGDRPCQCPEFKGSA